MQVAVSTSSHVRLPVGRRFAASDARRSFGFARGGSAVSTGSVAESGFSSFTLPRAVSRPFLTSASPQPQTRAISSAVAPWWSMSSRHVSYRACEPKRSTSSPVTNSPYRKTMSRSSCRFMKPTHADADSMSPSAVTMSRDSSLQYRSMNCSGPMMPMRWNASWSTYWIRLKNSSGLFFAGVALRSTMPAPPLFFRTVIERKSSCQLRFEPSPAEPMHFGTPCSRGSGLLRF